MRVLAMRANHADPMQAARNASTGDHDSFVIVANHGKADFIGLLPNFLVSLYRNQSLSAYGSQVVDF
jgi:hypothetical protein